ncbi:MAG TPA: hypothetical protein VF756_12130 [Thermoanaerobaculia bacterium]
MKVRIPIMIDDPYTSRKGFKRDYEMVPAEEDFFLDGPVTRRVAVLDFDPQSGALQPGARYVPPKKPNGEGGYDFQGPNGIYQSSFIQVSTFATVLETMYMFEEPDALGRSLTWAFDAPQLLVVPRAGEWDNAFYERESRSLQFFYISQAGGQPVYTSLSRDIIAHETAHAILDGISPTLYHAVTPQSLALHEAIADLTALLMSFRSRELRYAVLRETEGSLDNSTAFSTVAPQFGKARDGMAEFLRNLNNLYNLHRGSEHQVSRYHPHSLSQVLSGALYSVLVKIYKAVGEQNPDWPSGKVLFVASERFKRMIFRALDYMPPGEVSFRDYGRAILAADQAAHPTDKQEREWICDEFVQRGIVLDRKALEVQTNFPFPGLSEVDLGVLQESDWAAYELVNRNRDFFAIPKEVSFHVHPRLKTEKYYFRKKGSREPVKIPELILKVSWSHPEPNQVKQALVRDRQITVGTTVAIDWETRNVRTCLSSDLGDEQRQDRDGMIQRMLDDGILRIGDEALGPDGKPLCAAIRAETLGGTMRVRGAARLLHIAEED